MKTLFTTILLFIMVVLMSFTSETKSHSVVTYYAFVGAIEHDKRYDEPGNNGYVT